LLAPTDLVSIQSLDLVGEGEESTPAPDEFKHPTTPGVTTVVVLPAPRTQELTAAQQKKNRDREYQRRKRAMRRSAGTVSDEDSQSIGTGRRPLKRARIGDDE
jgi:chromatin modification-related protein EAF6